MTQNVIMLLVVALLGLGLTQPCEARTRHRKAQSVPEALDQAAAATVAEPDVDPTSGRCNPAGEATTPAPAQKTAFPEESAPATEPTQRGEMSSDVGTDRCDPSGENHEVAPAPVPKPEADEEERPRARRRHRREQEQEERERPVTPTGPILASFVAPAPEDGSARQYIPSTWKNNNPGNIKKRKSGIDWPGTKGYDKKGHAIFWTLEEGVAALQSCLFTNVIRGGYRTPQRMVNIYTETAGDRANYVQVIRRWTGVSPDQEFRLLKNGQIDSEKLFGLLQAVVTVEQGRGTISRQILEAGFQHWTGRTVV